jgi:hypothetical protein
MSFAATAIVKRPFALNRERMDLTHVQTSITLKR